MFKKWSVLAFVLVLALGAFLRFFWLGDFPLGLHPEEARTGNLAYEVLKTKNVQAWYPELRAGGLFAALETVPVRIFGNAPWTLRIIPALAGTLTILGIYYAMHYIIIQAKLEENSDAWYKNFFSAPLFSSFLLAASYWHMQYSRLAFPEILVPFCFAFGLSFLLKGLTHGTILDLIGAGIFIGLGFYTTPLFWVLSLLFLAPAARALREYKKGLKKFCVPCGLALVLFTSFVATIPLGLHFFWNPQDFQIASFLKEFSGAAQKLFLTAYTFEFIFNAGDPAFRNMTALLLFAAGVIGYGTWRTFAQLLAWFEKQKMNFPHRARQIARIQRNTVFLIYAALFLIPLKTYHAYFFQWADHPNTYFTQTTDMLHLGEYIGSLPHERKKYVVVNGKRENTQPIMFAAQASRNDERKEKNIFYLQPADALAAVPNDGSVITFLDGSDRRLVGLFRKKFPELSAKAPGDFVILEKSTRSPQR